MKISRHHVFALGDKSIDSENAIQLFYYSCAWGLGLKARNLRRRLRNLAQHRQLADDLLTRAWTSVRQKEDPRSSYEVLTTSRGAGRIPWFGPAFSTKFLYFAQGLTDEPQLAILDQVVARNLRCDTWPNSPAAAWWPDTYRRYCDLLSRWAKEASKHPEVDGPVRTDDVEFALFTRKSSQDDCGPATAAK